MENNNQPELDPKKVESLHKLLAVFDTERLTSKDFMDGFEKVVGHVKATQNLTVTNLKIIAETVSTAIQQMAKRNDGQLAAIRDELSHILRENIRILDVSIAKKFAELDEASGNILNGKDADEDVVVEKVLARIPPAPPQALGEDFRNALEALQDDDRLDVSAIRGIDELKRKIDAHSVVIGNNPGTGLADSSGNIGRFQYLKFPGATITTLDDTATITVAGTSLSLTTTGTSGPATLVGSTLNVPNYSTGSGGISRSVNSISTNTAAGAAASTDYVYYVSGATTLTLPTAVGNTNVYRIMRTGTSTVAIATTASQTINGAASPLNLIVQYASVDIQSDGSNWFIH